MRHRDGGGDSIQCGEHSGGMVVVAGGEGGWRGVEEGQGVGRKNAGRGQKRGCVLSRTRRFGFRMQCTRELKK